MPNYSVQDQIADLQKKLTLHEGDLKAYDEASKHEIAQNNAQIAQLRAGNKALHRRLAEAKNGDAKVIENALGDRKAERQALRSKAGREAVDIIDQKVCDYMKKLNALRAETQRKRQKYEECCTKQRLMSKHIDDQVSISRGESEKATYLRSIENRLDKSVLRQQEAEHMKNIYEKLRNTLQQKALTFNNILESHEQSIEEADRELKRVQEMLEDAQKARDHAKDQLNSNEEALIKQRRQRERELQELRLRAEEKRGVEAMERRATRQTLSRTGTTPQADAIDAGRQVESRGREASSVDLEEQLEHYEEIYQKIKDATGVSSIVEAVNRFESQGETANHLEKLKSANEEKLTTLQEEKIMLESKFNTLQYSNAESIATVDTNLKNSQTELDTLIRTKHEYQEQLEKQNKLLLNVRSGVQHLADKLDFVDGKGGEEADETTITDGTDIVKQIGHILSRSGLRINNLINSLGEDGLEGAKQRANNDLTSWATKRVEEIQPFSAIRVHKKNTPRAPGDLSDGDTSGEDDGQMLTREAIKKQAQHMIDAKLKKKRGGGRKGRW